MINRLLYHLQRPEKGWDPVSLSHVQKYGNEEWAKQEAISRICDRIEDKIGGMKNKSVLDLGAGPGLFSIIFAQRGANVTWHDISRGYQEFTRKKLQEQTDKGDNLKVSFSLGYLEDAVKLEKQFDFIFSRLCWLYCLNDFKFAEIIYNMIKPGGYGYIDTNHIGFAKSRGMSLTKRIFTLINEHSGIKIRHPYPSQERVKSALDRLNFKSLEYRVTPTNIHAWLKR